VLTKFVSLFVHYIFICQLVNHTVVSVRSTLSEEASLSVQKLTKREGK